MVSIITINYNGYKDTCELIDSLKGYETYPYEVIVVDNASASDDARKLKAGYPEAIVVASPENLGFAGGNNLGYEHAKGEYILYLNNDILIEAPFLEALVNRIDSDEKIGAVSSKIKYTANRNVIQYAGYTAMNPITTRNELIGVGKTDVGQYNEAHTTPFIHGACVLTSRKVIETVGNMPSLYFLFYEELDWSVKLRNHGYELWYEPSATVYHKESMSIKRGSPARNYYLTRSRVLFTRRNIKGINRVLAIAYQTFVSYPKNMLQSAIKGDWKMVSAITRGLISGFTSPIK